MTALAHLHSYPRIFGILCAVAALVSPCQAQPARSDDLETPLAVLRNDSAAPAAIEASADLAVSRAARAGPARKLIEILEGSGDQSVKERLLAAIARSWDPPIPLYPVVVKLSADTVPTIAAGAIRAVAAYRTPAAARALLDLAQPDRPAPTREAAFAGLIQMTGRDDLGTTTSAWAAWLEGHARLRTAEWQAALAEGVWRRATRLDAEHSALVDRTIEGYRRLYLALPQPPASDRPRLMAQLLRSNQPQLRVLAFELLSREISAGSPIDPAVADAAMSLLEHPDPAARAKAAELTLQLCPPDARSRLTQALIKERDPAVAADLLPAAVRWPDPHATSAILAWLASEGEPRYAAIEAADALYAAGLLVEADRSTVLKAIRSIDFTLPSPAGYRLLVALGGDPDRDAVTSMLKSDSAPARAAAADALAERPESWSTILEAAQSDPALFDAAVRATITSHAGAAGLLAVQALPAMSEDAHRDGMLLLAAAVSAADLVRVASRPDMDPAHRQILLTRLLEHGPSMSGHSDNPLDVTAGILLLAQADLKLGHPDQALTALDALPPNPPDPVEVLRTRLIALVWTNHLEQAAALDMPVSAWLEALELALSEPHARDILREIQKRFGPSLTTEETTRLEALAKRVNAQTPTAPARATAPDSPG